MPTQLLLYSTSGCHLCDEAWDIVVPACREMGLEVAQIDICTDEHLEQLYEMRIPVAQLQGQELDWPFTTEDLQRFLETYKN
ncbi:MAG TPA: glutaredoxin family protein [Methylophilaceae bacterium]